MSTDLLRDSWTIVIKEWREWFGVRARFGWFVLLGVIAIWDFIAPRVLDYIATESWLIVIVWAVVPMTLAALLVTDSITGERERQTLETLLSSRLSNCAIILGKMGAAILLGWALLAVSLVSGAVAAAMDGFVPHNGLSLATLAIIEVTLGAPTVVLMVCLGALLAIYLPGTRVSLLLISAFAWSVALGAFTLAVWWVSSGGGFDNAPPDMTLTLLATILILLDTVLLIWLLYSARRSRLLAIG